MTNADKIRNMTDEELSQFLGSLARNRHTCFECPARPWGSCYTCEGSMLQWLQKEVKKDD